MFTGDSWGAWQQGLQEADHLQSDCILFPETGLVELSPVLTYDVISTPSISGQMFLLRVKMMGVVLQATDFCL